MPGSGKIDAVPSIVRVDVGETAIKKSFQASQNLQSSDQRSVRRMQFIIIPGMTTNIWLWTSIGSVLCHQWRFNVPVDYVYFLQTCTQSHNQIMNILLSSWKSTSKAISKISFSTIDGSAYQFCQSTKMYSMQNMFTLSSWAQVYYWEIWNIFHWKMTIMTAFQYSHFCHVYSNRLKMFLKKYNS